MTIKEVAPKNWEVYAVLGNEDGKPVRARKRGFENKTSAKIWFTNEQVKFRNGESKYNKKTPSENLTVQGVYDIWLANYERKGIANSTLKQTLTIFKNHILKKFATRSITDLSVDELQDYINDLSDKYSAQSKKIYTYFNQLMNYASNRDFISKNPFNQVEIGAKNKRKQSDEVAKTLDAEHFKAWIEALDTHIDEIGFQIYTALRLISVTGMRPQELVGLQWHDIDFDTGELLIRRRIIRGEYGEEPLPGTKNGTTRQISIRDDMISIIKEWYAQSAYTKPTDYMFSSDGKFFSPQRPNKWLKKYSPKWGLSFVDEKFRVYSLRHTFATLALESKNSPRAVADHLGHTDANMTLNTYAKSTNRARASVSDWQTEI
ncbi:MAG TPA: tyrosine-type recombinase/integrase [Lactobacillaceae bacterium]|jgi:integrase